MNVPVGYHKIEAKFRLHAFFIYYKRSFSLEQDNLMRFGKALEASCRPIRDRDLVMNWWQEHCESRRGRKAKVQ